MKTSVCKDYTTLAELPRVKADLKEFKARYTDGDLKSFFMDETQDYSAWCHDVVSASVQGFPAGTDYNDETSFCVDLVTMGTSEFCKIRFYCNMELQIDLREVPGINGTPMKLWKCETYKPV